MNLHLLEARASVAVTVAALGTFALGACTSPLNPRAV